MKVRRISLGLLCGYLFLSVSMFAADPGKAFDARLDRLMSKLNRETKGSDGGILVAKLIQREYGTSSDELQQAAKESVGWGEITVLAYIQATTGRSFEAITKGDARRDFGAYVEKADMSTDKMSRSLESFLKLVEKERNSKIFEQLRISRRIEPMPDLGSGFGLFQEALDFRRIDSPRPTKIHDVVSGKAKGDQ
jgi:hypothetical protein